MNIIISEAQKRHTDDIVLVWEQTQLTRPWNDPVADVDLSLRAHSSILYVAENEEQVVGTVMAGYDGHRGWIYYLAVLPDYQGQGIGKKLYDMAHQWLKDQGAPKVHILIRDDNMTAVSFYERLGFEKSTSLLMGKVIEYE